MGNIQSKGGEAGEGRNRGVWTTLDLCNQGVSRLLGKHHRGGCMAKRRTR